MGFKKPTHWHFSTLQSGQTHTHTHSAYGNMIRGVQEPFASHISCMTAFHHGGWLDQEARSYLCEVLTAKYCRSGLEYFLSLLWHHDTKQLLWISGSLLCGNLWYVCEQTSLTCLWLWRDNSSLKNDPEVFIIKLNEWRVCKLQVISFRQLYAQIYFKKNQTFELIPRCLISNPINWITHNTNLV